MLLAIFVAYSILLEAPVVMQLKMISSAARPPVNVAILLKVSTLDINKRSSSSMKWRWS